MPIPRGFKSKEEYATYMREYRKRRKKEFDSIVAEWTTFKQREETPPDVEKEQPTEEMEDVFKPKELLIQERDAWKQKFLDSEECCRFQSLLLMNSERRNEVLELLVTHPSLARKR
jgi:hypothetical protein